jgi:trehalose monomycolate/heme transporter
MFAGLGKLIYKRRWTVFIAGIIFLVLSGVYGTSVFSNLKPGGFNEPNSESTKALVAMQDKLGRDDVALIVFFTSKDGTTVDNPAYKQAVEATLAKINGKEGVGTITTFYNSGASQLVSANKQSTYAVVGLNGDDATIANHMKTLRPLITGDTLTVQLGGEPAINEEISKQVSEDIKNAEILTFPILTVLLIFIFGSLIAASLPLAIGGLTILGAFLLLAGLTQFADVSIFASSIVTILGLGLAIDYSLFVVSRYREELVKYKGDVPAALTKTMQTAGRTVVFSGLTVAISLLSLLVFPQMFLRSMGLGGATAVLVAMIASITVLPAILALLGKRINSLSVLALVRRNRPVLKDEKQGFWYSFSHLVMRRPVIVLIITLVPMIYVGLPFMRINFSVPDAKSLPAKFESRIVADKLESDFPRNETGPIQVVVRTNGTVSEAANLEALYDYTRQINAIPGVKRVDSLVTLNPQLDKTTYQQFYAEAARSQNPQAAQAYARFAKDNYTLVSVLYETDTLAGETQKIVKDIRALSVPAGMSVEVGGRTAYLIDFLATLQASVPVALALIVGVIFVLLFLMLGSITVPLKAVVLNILSLSASFGALVWVFQDGNLANLFNFTATGAVDGTQPILIFAIAFGLSMDYEVFLLSRIKEQYDRTGDTTGSVAIAVQKTGGIITSAAALLFIVIAGFALGDVLFIKQIGVGLALAILVDATVVRMLLVPATMRLMGKYNWWAPAPLRAIYNRFGLSEVEHEDTPAPVATAKPEKETVNV